MPTITPYLWYDQQAEEAMHYYASIFKDAVIGDVTRGPDGAVTMATFRLNGQAFIALNGGPHFKFNEAISLYVDCQTQDEVDELWEKLSEGGEKSQCGWLKDKYGLSWQIVPSVLGRLMQDPDPEKAGRVMQAMLKMSKIDSAALQRAYDGVA